MADVVGHPTTRMTHEVYRHAVRPSVSVAEPVMEELFTGGSNAP